MNLFSKINSRTFRIIFLITMTKKFFFFFNPLGDNRYTKGSMIKHLISIPRFFSSCRNTKRKYLSEASANGRHITIRLNSPSAPNRCVLAHLDLTHYSQVAKSCLATGFADDALLRIDWPHRKNQIQTGRSSKHSAWVCGLNYWSPPSKTIEDTTSGFILEHVFQTIERAWQNVWWRRAENSFLVWLTPHPPHPPPPPRPPAGARLYNNLRTYCSGKTPFGGIPAAPTGQ